MAESTVRLSIIFLNFNRLAETKQTLEALRTMIVHLDGVEIIAVDNGSDDGTAEYLSRQEDITVVLLDDNQGIAGYNSGFKKARGEYLLVLDDDSCPENEKTLLRLIAVLDTNPLIGIVACSIRSVDGSPQWSWHLPKNSQFGPSPFFIGCGFAVRRDVFEQVNWYPGEFFLYQNEIDVAFKVRLNHFQIYYDPESIVVHRGEPSQRPGWRRIYYPTRNTIWLIRTYYPQPMAAYMICSRLLIGLMRALHFNEMAAYGKAVREALLTPVDRKVLPGDIRQASTPFWKQNSLLHQIFKLT